MSDMTPTLEDQVRAIAEDRCPRKGLPIEPVVELAMRYLYAGKCQRAPQAIEWAFHDLWDKEADRPIRPLIDGSWNA